MRKSREEAGGFNIDDVIGEVTEKLIRRHPHVFGTSDARDSGAVLKQWEAIKRDGKNGRDITLMVFQRRFPR